MAKIAHNKMQRLSTAKWNILNGKLKKARSILFLLRDDKDPLKFIKWRYLALIDFLEEKYSSSLTKLNHKVFFHKDYYKQICLLKILNLIKLDKKEKLVFEKTQCQLAIGQNDLENPFWLNFAVDLEISKEKTSNLIKNVAQTSRGSYTILELRNWFKAALISQNQDYFLDSIPNLPTGAYFSPQMRELIGHTFFRAQKYKQARDFLEDLSSPNALNLQGNIYLQEDHINAAYEVFKKALIKKRNSLNAMKRILPLSWSLEKPILGNQVLSQIPVPKKLKPHKNLLRSAFLLKQGRNQKAHKTLQDLSGLFSTQLPQDFLSLMLFSSIEKSDQESFLNYSRKGCQKMDGVSCWLEIQHQIFPGLIHVLKRQDKILEKPNQKLENLLSQKGHIEEALKVDKSHIEELDLIEGKKKNGDYE